MAVTQKDFEAFAKLLASEADRFRSETQRGGFAVKVADYFAASNPRFNRQKFLAACNVREA